MSSGSAVRGTFRDLIGRFAGAGGLLDVRVCGAGRVEKRTCLNVRGEPSRTDIQVPLELKRRQRWNAATPETAGPKAIVTKQLPNIRFRNFLTIQYSLYTLPSLLPLSDGIRTRRDGAVKSPEGYPANQFGGWNREKVPGPRPSGSFDVCSRRFVSRIRPR